MIVAHFDRKTGARKGKPCGEGFIPQEHECRSAPGGARSGKSAKGRSGSPDKKFSRAAKKFALKAVEQGQKKMKKHGVKVTNEGLAALAVSAALVVAGATAAGGAGKDEEQAKRKAAEAGRAAAKKRAESEKEKSRNIEIAKRFALEAIKQGQRKIKERGGRITSKDLTDLTVSTTLEVVKGLQKDRGRAESKKEGGPRRIEIN